MSKIYAFDLDDTICVRNGDLEHLGPDKYKHCTPIVEMVNIVNQLYDQGNTIYIYTARGMGQFYGNVNRVHNELYVLTLESLKEWGVKHHGLVMGKLHYDFLIDDKVINVNDIDSFLKNKKENEQIGEFKRVKKIAICLSGELRTWRDTIDSWSKIVDIPNVEIDFFFHAWNTVNPPSTFYSNKAKEDDVPIEDLENEYKISVSKEEMDELVDRLKPKAYLFEESRKFTPKNPNQSVVLSHAISQFYSTMRAGRLKREYEIENDFMYDLVIKSRFDLFFYKPVITEILKPERNTMYGNHFTYTTEGKFYGRIGDIFWYSDSLTYDILTDFYFDLPNIETRFIQENLPPEFSWYSYIIKNRIKVNPHKDWMIKTFRGNPEYIVHKESDYEI